MDVLSKEISPGFPFPHLFSSPLLGTSQMLTHVCLASFLWDIGKQNIFKCDVAKCGVPSGTILFAFMYFIEK